MRTRGIIIILAFALTCCTNKKASPNLTMQPDSSVEKITIVNHDSLLLSLTRQVLTTLKNKDYSSFEKFIHPTLGTRFTPYGFIDTTVDIRLTANEFRKHLDKKSKLNWGNYDGSGDSIILTISEYFNKFVYNADFLHAEKTSVNKMIGSGNSFNNLPIVYKDCDFTESYFPGFEKKYGGMDWTSLRLVYQKFEGNYYLVAVVHDQWTI